jgi:hypothetical protein
LTIEEIFSASKIVERRAVNYFRGETVFEYGRITRKGERNFFCMIPANG